jgi:hypothetical protein
MNRIELERAWPAAEPPPGFSNRVIEHLQQGPAGAAHAAPTASTARRASSLGWLTTPGLRWLALAAVALALVGVFVRLLERPDRNGDVIAAEARVVSIGERAVAEMSSGAHIRWSGDEVQQDRGEVTYRVVSGASFRVQTPHGSVAVLGTVFRVVVADRNEEGEEPMKKRWAIAGTSATLGALLFVSVDQGSVRLWRGEHELILGAGQSGSIGSDGIPHVGSEAPGAAALVPPGPPAPGQHEPSTLPRAGGRPATPEAQRLRARVLDSLRARQQEHGAENANSKPAAAGHAPGTMVDRTGEIGAENMRVINHEFIPLVADCYDQALERNPRLRGMLAVNVELAGAEEVGGIIESVEPAQDRNQVADEELIECVRQSAFSIQLPAPTKSGRKSGQFTIPLGSEGSVDAGR